MRSHERERCVLRWHAAAGRLDEGSPTPAREYRDPINHEAVIPPYTPTPPLRALRDRAADASHHFAFIDQPHLALCDSSAAAHE